MHCNHQFVTDHINDYIEDNLSKEIKNEVANCLNQCNRCNETYKQYLEMYQLSHQWQEQEVPDWHRVKYAIRPPLRQSNWLSWGSLATSTLAILMVVFQLEVVNNDRGLTISFGGSQTEDKISKQVELQLANYKSNLNQTFETKLNVALEKQNNLTKIRLADWLEKNRSERQQDIKFVMTGWQSQRYEDQKLVDQQISYLADNQIENNQAINQLYSVTDARRGRSGASH